MRRFVIGIAVLGGLVCAGGLFVAAKLGVFRTIEPHFAGQCRSLDGVVGAEDIVIDPVAKRAWISSDDRRATLAGQPVRGRLYTYDLSDPGAAPVDATPDAPIDFHPHGLSLYTAPDGARTLFVINHQSFGGQRIEVYAVDAHTLVYQGGIVTGAIRSPNAILAVGDRQFYVTNDHGSTTPLGRQLEDLFALPRANVVYFDGQSARVVADGLRFANGIEMSADGTQLYVAETMGDGVRIYAREPIGGSLRETGRIALGTAPDNIKRDAAGNLWIAGHPKLADFIEHVQNADQPAPTQILRVAPAGDGFAVDEVMMDTGETLSAAATGVVLGQRMLVGPVFADHMLDCTLGD